jgi:hypothetical protein
VGCLIVEVSYDRGDCFHPDQLGGPEAAFPDDDLVPAHAELPDHKG